MSMSASAWASAAIVSKVLAATECRARPSLRMAAAPVAAPPELAAKIPVDRGKPPLPAEPAEECQP